MFFFEYRFVGETMSSSPVYMTRDGVAKLEEEIRYLKSKGRTEIAEKISYARSHGDLSENAEYDAAKEAQGLLELKIKQLEEVLPNDKIYFLSTAKLKNLNTGKTVEYSLVSAEEADYQTNKIAVSSLLGKALLGKVVGDIISTKVPAGEIQYEVLEIGKLL